MSILRSDIVKIAKDLNFDTTKEHIDFVVDNYEAEAEQDVSGAWDLWIESLLHQSGAKQISKDERTEVEKKKDLFYYYIGEIEKIIATMPQKGNKASECQRIALQQKLNEFSTVVNGIEQSDLIK